MGEGEKRKFLSFSSLLFSLPSFPFSPETLDTQAKESHTTAAFQLQNLRGEEQRTLLWGRLRLSHSTSNEIVFITARVLQAIFNALVYPYLTFGNIIWASTYPTSLEGIYKIQKKIVRIATFSKDTQETRSLFLSLNVQTIYELSSYHWNYSCILTLVDNCRHLFSD